MAGRRYTPEDVATIHRMLAQDATNAEIANAIGRDRISVNNFLRHHRIKTTRPPGRYREKSVTQGDGFRFLPKERHLMDEDFDDVAPGMTLADLADRLEAVEVSDDD
jgi:IS30 family transposase